MTIHTSTFKGKRVYIALKNGDKFVDKFMDKKSGYVVTKDHGKIKKGDIKTMTIFRNKGSLEERVVDSDKSKEKD
jgi:hypothetical protein